MDAIKGAEATDDRFTHLLILSKPASRVGTHTHETLEFFVN